MVCEKCEKKLGKVITPDPWKSGARNTTESGGRRINENKALTSSSNRFNPYTSKFETCKICRQKVHQVGSHYCQSCAYKKGICAMCGIKMEQKVCDADNTDTSSSKRRREDKIRKRDPKAWDNIYKTISPLPDAEKIESIAKKYAELYTEFRKVSQNCQNLEKNYGLLQKEREHIRTEQAKSILARSRLENLCRELQKQNKQIKEENIAKIKEEEERRREVAAKFQKTLDDVTSMMTENREKNYKLRDDNIDMSKKISELYQEFQKREEDITRMSKQMDLEKQLAQSTTNKLECELNVERELRSKLLLQLEQSEARNKQLTENIKSMEDHISVYKGQYEVFEKNLDESNKIFDNCKSEMVKMSKQIFSLEKEANNWKSKWQVSTKSLIELSTLKQKQDLQLVAADKKIEQLQKLCRQLQVDRGAFLKLLKTNGIEPVSQVCVENTEKPPSSKERELVILKDSLRMLQEQLRYSLNNAPDSMEVNDNIENKNVETTAGTTDEIIKKNANNNVGFIENEVCQSNENMQNLSTQLEETVLNGNIDNPIMENQCHLENSDNSASIKNPVVNLENVASITDSTGSSNIEEKCGNNLLNIENSGSVNDTEDIESNQFQCKTVDMSENNVKHLSEKISVNLTVASNTEETLNISESN